MQKSLAVLAAIFTLPLATFSEDTKDRPLVTVSGPAEVLVAPDDGAFNLRVVSLDKDLPTTEAKLHS